MKQKPFTITEKEKELTKSLLKKITETEKEKFSIADLDTVYSFLNKKEIAFLKKLLTIDPHDYDIKGEYLGIQDVPKDLVEIKGQRYETGTEEQGYHEIGKTRPQYIAADQLRPEPSRLGTSINFRFDGFLLPCSGSRAGPRHHL